MAGKIGLVAGKQTDLRFYAKRVLWVMFTINFLNYMDRFILPTALSSIQKEFHFTDFAAGSLATAFTLVYAITALPFGTWADRGIRKNVVAVSVGLWSIATMLTGLATNFATLFLARAAVGVGEGGYYPAGTSLLIDYYPRDRRAWILGLWNVGASIGVAVGFAIGGVVSGSIGWRWAFYFTVIPGLICTVLAYRMREPKRGASDPAGSVREGAAPIPFKVAVRSILAIRSMRYALAAQTLNFFVLGAAVLWFPSLLERRFGVSSGTAGLLSGGVLVLAGIIGTLGGGWLADKLITRYPSARLLVTAVAFILTAPLLVIALSVPTLGLCIPFLFLSGMFLQAYNGPMSALMQDVVPIRLRASAVAVSLVVAHLLGDSFSPALVGGLSDSLGHNLDSALLLTLPAVILVAGLIGLRGLHTVEPDMDTALSLAA